MPSHLVTNREAIDEFKKSFNPSNSHNAEQKPVNQQLFIKDGEILFMNESGELTLNVEYDLNVGYKVQHDSNVYFENFTYGTGRYLSEIQ